MSRRGARGAAAAQAAPASRRRPRPASAGSSELPLGGIQQVESHPDGDWQVRRVVGVRGAQTYRCPGCQQLLAAATGHVVAWPAERWFGAAEPVELRRHWHTACWSARARRSPPVERARNAPRHG